MRDAFEQAKQHFIAGNTAFEAGDFVRAEAQFEASLALLPERVSTLGNLAAVHLHLGRPEAALALLDQALALDPSDLPARLHRSTALGDLGREDEALVELDRVLAQVPDHPAARYHRARTLGALQRYAEAAAGFEHLLRLDPRHALAWFGHGQSLQYLDRPAEALASYDQALALAPGQSQAWSNRGHILKHQGREAEAAQSYREAIAHGGDAALNAYYLAGLTRLSGEATPPAPPRQYVEELFDNYAEGFDAHVVGALGFQGHSVLLERLKLACGPVRRASALDLGCGTGLCAPALLTLAERVDGVDLSAAMLDKARALGLYRQLDHADVAEHLARSDQRHDIVAAADVFIYVGDLRAVFAGVARVLRPGGLFGFSIELAADALDIELRSSLRYAHSQRHVLALAAEVGLEPVSLHAQPLRQDQGQPIAGLYLVLRLIDFDT